MLYGFCLNNCACLRHLYIEFIDKLRHTRSTENFTELDSKHALVRGSISSLFHLTMHPPDTKELIIAGWGTYGMDCIQHATSVYTTRTQYSACIHSVYTTRTQYSACNHSVYTTCTQWLHHPSFYIWLTNAHSSLNTLAICDFFIRGWRTSL